METQVQSMARAQRDKWEILGCKPIWQRGTVRLPQFMKTFPHNQIVTVRDSETGEYSPFKLRSGRNLVIADIMPERADLALDDKGRLVDQMQFEKNYAIYLDSFVMAPGSEIQNEPVPNVARFVNAKIDPWGESRGSVEVDFDPQLDKQFVAKKLIDKDGNDAELADMKSLLSQLAKMQLAQANIGQNSIAVEAGPAKVDPEEIPVGQMSVADVPDDKERMPCGKWKAKGYRNQHMLRCNHELCGGPGANVIDRDAA